MKRARTNSLQDETTIANCYAQIVKCVLKHGCNIEEQVSKTDFNKLLHVAVINRQESVVKALVKNGADIYSRDKSGNTVLTIAKKYANDQIYDALVHTKVNANLISSKNFTSFRKISIILLLLESFYANYFPTLYCNYESICKNPIDTALLIINSNAMIKDYFLDVHDAVQNGYEDIIDIILSSGVDINTRDKFGRLMLQCACYQGNVKAVQYLLTAGADVNRPDAYQRSSLHTAIVAKQIEIVKLLIKNGANVNARKFGRNLLYSAIDSQEEKGLELVRILVKEGVDLNDGHRTNLPLLHYVIEENCIDIAEFLIKKGANVNNQNMQGETCLHCSIKALHIKGDHDIDVQHYYDLFTLCWVNKKHWSTRWHRRMNEQVKMTLLLLKYGADPNFEDDNGKTPLTMCNVGTMGLVLLIKHLAKMSSMNVQINDKNLNFINKNSKFSNFFAKCKEELELMKNISISSNISFYNFLYELNIDKLVIYAKNEIVKQIIYDSKYERAKFPIYHKELKSQYTEGRKIRSLLDLAAAALNEYFHFHMPNLVAEKIMLYLNYEDWTNLIKSR